MSEIKIKKVTKENIGSVKQLMLEALQNDPLAFTVYYDEYAFASQEWWDKYLESYTNPLRGIMLLAEMETKYVGMAGLLFRSGRRNTHVATIVWVYVDPAQRSHGIGQKLMNEILEIVQKDTSLKKLTLYVNGKQDPAKKIYEKLGFKVVGTLEKELFINGEFIDTIIMEKFLD
jgi:ribosomal protein S18 acetylase RimI-like enzyme